MPDFFFNMEIGASPDKEKGLAALLSASKAYKRYQADFKISSGSNPSSSKIIRQGQICDSIKDCYRYFPQQEQEVVKILLHGLSRGTILTDDILQAECENWHLDELCCPSPLLEYAARKNGIALTVATDPCWEKDFFSFQNQPHQLPNLWTETKTSHIDAWLSSLFEKDRDYDVLLRRKINAVRCKGVLKNNDLSPGEWETLFAAFEKAQERNYAPDDNLIKVTTSHTTEKWGPVLELRLYGDGLRFFFVNANSKLIIGGYYQKGRGSSPSRENILQDKAIAKAKKAINNYNCSQENPLAV